MASDRPRIRGTVDEDTVDAWDAFVRERGLTLSALLEAIGRMLDPADPDPFLLRAEMLARQVMADRKGRRRDE